MTVCPHPGALRAALDGERDDLRQHVAGCAVCAAASDRLTADARYAAGVFAALGDPPAVDADAALASVRRPAALPVADLAEGRTRRGSAALLSRAAAVLLVVATGALLVGTPAGRAAAGAVLDRFRSERLAVIELGDVAPLEGGAAAALEGFEAVEGLEVDGLEGFDGPLAVADLEEAARVSGITVAPLPAEVAGEVVQILAVAPRRVTVAFDSTRAPALPRELDGSTLVVDVPGAVVQYAGESTGGAPALVAGTSGQLVVEVEGQADLAQVREALLGLPGLPPETVAQLRALDDWERTLPIPVPEGFAWRDATVAGHPALEFGDDTGLLAAVVWNTGDQIHGVAGSQPVEVLRELAEDRT